ncbi:hypothetical protein G4G27_15035 [Sphingomonas sp. So64.6b]|uniref:hypothetical protein n=1 Tax=Sphingomonas sp. So64.6b TaxID=2997354 RepID=UPI00160494CD|nr:hypothetical protein [Sphingomonas sp. So64.6b]QNA85166.1 hypothetical protein G4G27_15035 [Sphingomonas sp. So64.6b]
MRSAAAALLFATLGLTLAFAPRWIRVPGLAAAVIGAAIVSVSGFPVAMQGTAFLGCWASLIVTAACVHLRGGPGPCAVLALSGNAGLWAGAVIATTGPPSDLLRALPGALIILPAAIIHRHAPIALKIASSWLIAVAMLAASLNFLPVTPGYQPDHLE